MLESTEILWFFKGNIPFKVCWSNDDSDQNISSENRIDYYLLIKDSNYVGIKLRNSKLKIKWRRNFHKFTNHQLNISGQMENWIKWNWNNKITFIEIDSVLKKINIILGSGYIKRDFRENLIFITTN